MGRNRMGVRQRRAERIAKSSRLSDFVDECRELESRQDNWRRNWSGGFGYRPDTNGIEYIATPLGTYRDANPREESNWAVIEPAMAEADSFGHVSEHPGVVFHTEGSALCGWVETIYIRTDDAAAIRQAMEFTDALANYPILDEEDCSRREWEADHPDENTCYADEGCGCDVSDHSHEEWFKAVCRNPESVENSTLFEIDTEEDAFWCDGPGCGEWVDMNAGLWNFYRGTHPGEGQLSITGDND